LKPERKRLCILLNSIAPYRIPIYAALADAFEVSILHGGKEAGRTWSISLPDTIQAISVPSLKIPSRKMTGVDGIRDRTYLHLNVGLLWWLPKLRPDIIISNELGLRTLIALTFGGLMGVPVWIWWGGTIHSEKNASPARKLLRRLIARHAAKRWISYGQTSTEYLLSLGAPRNHILQIQNCVRQETFQQPRQVPAEWFVDSKRPVLLYVGQLSARKGVDRLIEACGRFTSKNTFTLAIVGQGPERDRLANLAEESKLSDVLWIRNQPQEILSQIYKCADAFIFPTMEDNWGLVVNEALYSGLPVLCSKFAGCAQELLPPSNIFDPLSLEEWDRGLATVLEGKLAPPDLTRLKTWQEVSAMILASLEQGYPLPQTK
jgi:glycosyltransferase involved in cell wall biosynthesis